LRMHQLIKIKPLLPLVLTWVHRIKATRIN
jgi:hypothetical protein